MLWILEIATLLAAMNKSLPLLYTFFTLLYGLVLLFFDIRDDLLNRVEKRKFKVLIEESSSEFEILVEIRKHEIDEMQKAVKAMNDTLKEVRIQQRDKENLK